MENLTWSFATVVELLGLGQGIVFGLYLIIKNKPSRPSFYLGLFLIFLVADLPGSIAQNIGLQEHYSRLEYLPTTFFLQIPFLYFYTKRLLEKKRFKISKYWFFLLPGIFELFPYIPGLISPESKIAVDLIDIHYANYVLFNFLVTGFSLYLIYLILKLLKRNEREISDYYSNIEKWEVNWLRQVCWYYAIFSVVWLVFLFRFQEIEWLYTIMNILHLILIYWVTWHGIRQEKPEAIEFSESQVTYKQDVINETGSTNETENGLEQTPKLSEVSEYKEITDFVKEQHLYRDPDLTVRTLAASYRIAPRRLSNIIKTKNGQNFNYFINAFRIEEAKKLIICPKHAHLSMYGIALQVGFNSRSAFYRAFKDITGTTPTVYRSKESNTQFKEART